MYNWNFASIHSNIKEFQGKTTISKTEGDKLKVKPYKLLEAFYFWIYNYQGSFRDLNNMTLNNKPSALCKVK